MATTKQQPIHEIRMGAIKAAIWENQRTFGTRHNVTVAASTRTVTSGNRRNPSDAMICNCWPRWSISLTPGSSNNPRNHQPEAMHNRRETFAPSQ